MQPASLRTFVNAGRGATALGKLAELGVERIKFYCWSCETLVMVSVASLLVKAGADAELHTLARRARCRRCGTRGAHAEPSLPDRPLPHPGLWAEPRTSSEAERRRQAEAEERLMGWSGETRILDVDAHREALAHADVVKLACAEAGDQPPN